MKIAVACLAYMKNPAGAAVLAEYFRDAADLYLHVDAKSDISPYVDVQSLHPNVVLAAERHPIFWGGFNTVKACVSTIKQAVATKDYERILFITEDTIPLLGRSTFCERMSSSTEWIQIYPSDRIECLTRYTRYFFYDSFATTPRHCEINQREWTPDMVTAVGRLDSLMKRGKAPIHQMFTGGTWWGLTRASIDKFISRYEQDEHLRESFEFSAIPEEQYLHTVLGNLPDARPLVYTDFGRYPQPYVFQSVAEIAAAETHGAPMLRKVPVGVPEIEAYIRELARA
ncbi:beta-1,6-N-acetylglucosaminyltransferase [Xanthobacter sp. KR7-65]|uniref:beta-1,6-N-acetylglucosaminyltransferase n=1 Tax=Xanthobacter sp. KR7-65 TaxID=3156612 RepID=UPI0032B57908